MIKKNIQVVLFPQLKTNGTRPIKIRTTIKRKVQYLNLGISVYESQWDKKKLRVKSNHPEYKTFNNLIEDGIKSLYEITPYEITGNHIQNEGMHYKTIQTILENRIQYERSKNRISTEKKLTTALRHLVGSGLSKTQFILFNLDKIKQFHSYLFTIGGIQESSMGSYHRVIRSSLKSHAIEYEISSKVWSDPYNHFKTTRKTKHKFALKGSQVIRIEDYVLFNKRKNGDKFNSACMFLFSIYSYGSRFGDVYSLKWENIKENIIRFETEKNQRKIDIKLNPKINNILKYFTPLNDFYKDIEHYDDSKINEISKWFTNIYGLIQAEKEYFAFRKENLPTGHPLLDELFPHIKEKVVFQEERDDLKAQLELIISVRDNYVSSFIEEFAKHTHGHLFPYFNEGETDFRKIKNRKESSNAIVNKSLKMVAEECKIPSINFHEARHTFAYHARRNGFDVFEISKALGHSSISITQNYLNDFGNEEIMEKNEILIDGLNRYYLI